MLFEGCRIVSQEDVNHFLEKTFDLAKPGASTTGEDMVRWLEFQKMNELRGFGFEKLQGNSFSVYLLTIPALGGAVPDTIPLRKSAERSYRVGLPKLRLLLVVSYGNFVNGDCRSWMV